MKNKKPTGGFRVVVPMDLTYSLQVGDEVNMNGFNVKVKRITSIKADGKGAVEILGLYEDL